MAGRPPELLAPAGAARVMEGRIEGRRLGETRAELAKVQDWLLENTRHLAQGGAALVAWPEVNLLVLRDDEDAFVERARRIAAEERIFLAMGMGSVHPGAPKPLENKMLLIDPACTVVFSYRKSRLVPGWEASTAARGEGRLPVASTSVGR